MLGALMSEYFAAEGFRLTTACDGRSGLARALQGGADLVILDVTLPMLDGFEVLRQIRQRSTIPVIMLTARISQEERIAGLEAGADDYLPKPFEPGELLARVRAVLRRSGHLFPVRRTIVQIGDIELNPATREVRRGSTRIALTSSEFDILEVLMRSAGRVVSRDEIATVLYQRELTPYERSVDVHIGHLRKKLEDAGGEIIRTVRGSGYLFVPDAPA
jgi:two-component system response regulator CpxR